MRRINTLEGYTLVGGTVKAVYENKDDSHPTTVVLEESWFDKDKGEKGETVMNELRIAFFNSTKNPKVKTAEWAAKINVGSYITCLVAMQEPYNEVDQATGFSFKYSGCYTITNEEGNEQNVILGYFCPAKEQKNEMYYRGSIPETVRSKDDSGEVTEETIFHCISFGFSKSPQKAKNAEKCLKKRMVDGEEKCTRCLVICGENTGNEDFPYSYFGKVFEVIPRTQKAE